MLLGMSVFSVGKGGLLVFVFWVYFYIVIVCNCWWEGRVESNYYCFLFVVGVNVSICDMIIYF